MAQSMFQTSNLDLALTKAEAGVDVAYTGPWDGVFRFESVRLKALRARGKIARARGEDFQCALERLVEDAHQQDARYQDVRYQDALRSPVN
ncbi:hypothetical protein CCR94_22390 [Rhodoblastus sphagnicola]|uniref:Uncharacterized protein n=1 Tax=Rhodoblastus sphagnicola TaxID=333368 RepID=A0A2S6MVL4_9HYPH|nr:hypothetical protein [Rhodoblastus sphagnicola]MBB4197513.1 hypothetical protein [Rhodoblastus sphagnicola]PPQ26392.1 hypothetical protein CCR94_22390 [Rhodoblastus sphagnicola]